MALLHGALQAPVDNLGAGKHRPPALHLLILNVGPTQLEIERLGLLEHVRHISAIAVNRVEAVMPAAEVLVERFGDREQACE